jgi:hypothetical protein
VATRMPIWLTRPTLLDAVHSAACMTRSNADERSAVLFTGWRPEAIRDRLGTSQAKGDGDMAGDGNYSEVVAEHSGTAKKRGSAWTVSLAGLGVIFVVSVIVLIVAWSGNPSSDTLRYELAKTCMQVLAVAFFGGLATMATFNFQYYRTQEADHSRQRAEAEREEARMAAEAHDQKMAEWRGDVDDLRDERRRRDEQLRPIVEETLAAYNRVKRIRRLLAAETNGEAGRHLTRVVYDKHMDCLIDEQLAFERLKRLTPLINDERLGLPTPTAGVLPRIALKDEQSLADFYTDIEKYLNKVVDEYREKRHIVPDDANGVSLTGFDRLSGFIDKDDFVPSAADKIDQVIAKLQTALWQPLKLPTPPGGA